MTDPYTLLALGYSLIISFVFLIIHHIAFKKSGRARNGYDIVVTVWGALYTIALWGFFLAATWTVQLLGYSPKDPQYGLLVLLLAIGVPGVISAHLVHLAWKSVLIGFVMLAFTAIAILIFLTEQRLPFVLAPLVWNLGYAAVCSTQIESVRRQLKGIPAPDASRCTRCAYIFTDVPHASFCPECGTARPRTPEEAGHENGSVQQGNDEL